MRRFLSLAPVSLACSMLAGCADRPALEGRLDRPVVAATEAMRPCASPVALPVAPMPLPDVERSWAIDRTALADCRDRHASLVAVISRRQ